jgi:hypothetical protein
MFFQLQAVNTPIQKLTIVIQQQIFSPMIGCRYVAVTSGVIDEVNRVDTWSGKTNLGIDRGGLYVSFIGDDGVSYYASHLRSPSHKVFSRV